MKKWQKGGLGILALVLALVLTCYSLSSLFVPKRFDYGATWGQFLEEPDNSFDVMFLGSSLVYCDVNPTVIWEETGLSTYAMAGPLQTMPMTYYYLKEIYKTQSPGLVFVELTGMFYNRYEDFTESNLLYMPWSTNRLFATFEAAEPEKWGPLLFPVYNYHVRWQELTPRDWQIWLSGYETDPLCGYTYLDTAEPMKEITQDRFEPQDNYAENFAYLEKILALGEANGTQVVLYLAPYVDRPKAALLEQLQNDLGSIGYGELINFNETRWLDWDAYNLETDFYDPRHFNYQGAEKFSRRMGALITGELAYAGTGAGSAVDWQDKWDAYNALKAETQS